MKRFKYFATFLVLVVLCTLGFVQNGMSLTLAEKITLGTIHDGNGHEHAFKRLLLADPAFGGYVGDVNNVSALNDWANHEAHRIAIRAGFVDAFGKERRVRVAEKFADVLMKGADGKLFVQQYAVDDANGGNTELGVVALAPTFAQAFSVGVPDPGPMTRLYEYTWIDRGEV